MYFYASAVVAPVEGDDLLNLDEAGARALFAPPPDAPAIEGLVYAGPISTCRATDLDRAPRPETFGTSMAHAPAFGVGVWHEYGEPFGLPQPGSPARLVLDRLAASPQLHLHPSIFTPRVLSFAAGLRRRQAFFLAYEAGLLAQDRRAITEAELPEPSDPLALSIYLHRRVEPERLREAAAARARCLPAAARPALDLLLARAWDGPDDGAEGIDALDTWPQRTRRPPDALAEADALARELDALTAAGRPEQHNLRQRLLRALQGLGLFSTKAHPMAEELGARAELSTLLAYARASARLLEYLSSEARATIVGAPPPMVPREGAVSVDWFRGELARPEGVDVFSWTARCEKALIDGPPDTKILVLREGGAGFRIQLRNDTGERLVIAGATPISPDRKMDQ